MRPSSTLGNKIPSDTYWRVQLLTLLLNNCRKTIRTSCLWQIKLTLLNPLGSYMNIIESMISPRWSSRLEIPMSSRFEFFEKSFANSFTYLKHRTTPQVHWGKEVWQTYLCWKNYWKFIKSHHRPRFCEMIASFVL